MHKQQAQNSCGRPDDDLRAADDPPIDLKQIEPELKPKEEAPAEKEEVPEETPEEVKVEIKPNPNRESKIKRKATGFVNDPPPEDEGRKCCVLM